VSGYAPTPKPKLHTYGPLILTAEAAAKEITKVAKGIPVESQARTEKQNGSVSHFWVKPRKCGLL